MTVVGRRAMLVAATLLSSAATADPCRMTVALEGDPAAVAAIRDLLSARGIATGDPTCAGVRARVEWRGAVLAIGFARSDGAIDRVVSDAATAATVIESFVRVDVGAPLLATRALPAGSVRHAPASVPTPAPAPTEGRPAPVRARTGVHVFGSLDSAVAGDRTGWLGMQVGVCVMLGPTCPSARFRVDAVVAGAGALDDSTFRNSAELLVGIDVPLAVGTWSIMPGVAVGMGGVRTHDDAPDDGGPSVKRETTGLRGELHGALLIPLTAKLAVDLAVAGVLSQETKVDERPMAPVPPDPLLVFRFGLGLRYGRR